MQLFGCTAVSMTTVSMTTVSMTTFSIMILRNIWMIHQLGRTCWPVHYFYVQNSFLFWPYFSLELEERLEKHLQNKKKVSKAESSEEENAEVRITYFSAPLHLAKRQRPGWHSSVINSEDSTLLRMSLIRVTLSKIQYVVVKERNKWPSADLV